ncbi:MAG: FmdB family zinc ribbon protein [Legionellaceae bacterium]
MPIYEHQCSECHHLFDLIQKVNDEPVHLCPACGKHTVVRLVSAPGFQLKGTGWYETDFKNKGKPPVTDAASTGAKNSGGEKKEPAAAVPSTSTSKGDAD